jgi:hypothetical protein
VGGWVKTTISRSRISTSGTASNALFKRCLKTFEDRYLAWKALPNGTYDKLLDDVGAAWAMIAE